MLELLTKYWIELDTTDNSWKMIGVTAFTEEDALNLIKKYISNDKNWKIVNIKKDISISELDHNHIIPNIGIPEVRGIWYPKVQ